MNKAKTYFGEKMYLGLFFLNTWMDLIDIDNIEEAFKTIEKNPIKALPKLVQAGVNSTNEIEGSNEKISFFEACNIVEDNGGIASPDFKILIEDLSKTLLVEQEKKKKPKAKK